MTDKTPLDQLFTELETKADASSVEDIKSRIEAIEDANAKRTSVKSAEATEADTKAAQLEAAHIVTKGAAYINQLNIKATEASITVDAEGGYALPKIFNPDVTRYIRKGSPLHGLATVRNEGSKYSTLIKLDGSAADTRTEKGAFNAGNTDTYAELVLGQIDVYDSQKYTAWAEEGDTVIDIAGEIVRSVGENIGEKQGEHFMLGTTTNTLNGVAGVTTVPTGLIGLAQQASADKFTNSVGKLGVFSANIANDASDDWFGIMADLFNIIHSNYKNSVSYGVIISGDLELKLRKSKDLEGRFMWTNPGGVAVGQPGTIWGVPYYVDDYMPTVASTLAGGANEGKPVALAGDFSKYIINNYSTLKMIRDEFTSPGFIKYHSRQRIGGCLTDFQAIRGLIVT